MKFNHHDLVFELPDDWWRESNMHTFQRVAESYAPKADSLGRAVGLITIGDIAPCTQRAAVKGVFCDQLSGLSARQRVVSILSGFQQGVSIEPIEVRRYQDDGNCKYQKHHGSHRLHFSIAAGFTKIPAILARSSVQGLSSLSGNSDRMGISGIK